VNGRRLNIPSASVRSGDVLSAKPREATKELLRATIAANSGRPIPPWLTMNVDELKASINSLPTRDQIPSIAEEQLIVEFYSK
jgi:small subunit ribosomal protein S4